jgi:hypothetical protein
MSSRDRACKSVQKKKSVVEQMQECELTIFQCEGTQHTPIDPSNIYPTYTTRGRSRRHSMLFLHDANKLIIAHPLENSVLRVIIHDINHASLDKVAVFSDGSTVEGVHAWLRACVFFLGVWVAMLLCTQL